MSSFVGIDNDGPTIDTLDLLIAHVKSQQGYINKNIEFRDDPISGIGIFNQKEQPEVETNPLVKGQVLVSIPYDVCISVDSTKNISSLWRIVDDNPWLLDYPDEILAMTLMYARRPACDDDSDVLLRLHVKTLPKTFNTTLFWNDDELNKLKPCSVYHITRLMKDQMMNDWNTIHLPISQNYPELLGHVTHDLYVWALSIVYSRAVGINRKAGDEAADTFAYDDGNDTISLINTFDGLAPGHECFAIYGRYTNGKLALTYGFVTFGNPHRAVDMWTRLTTSSYEYSRKDAILKSNKLTANQTYDFNGTIRENYISAALLATIRIIQINDELELQRHSNAFNGIMISVRNELATYYSLKNLIIARMSIDSAEVEKNQLGQMLLEGTVSMSDRTLIALIVTVDERELLSETLALVDGYIAQLTSQNTEYICPDAACA